MRIRSAIAVVSTLAVLGPVGVARGEPHGAGHGEHAKADKANEEAKAGDKGKPEKAGKGEGKGEEERGKSAAHKNDNEQGEDEEDKDEDEHARPWTKLAKKEERLAALKAKLAEKEESFQKRREATRSRELLHWGALAANPDVQKELREHSERVARLRRIRDLAEIEGDAGLLKRVEAALKKEHERHEKEVARLRGLAKAAAHASPSAEAAPSSTVNAEPSMKGGAQ